MADANEPAQPRTRTWVRVALVVSLALNLLVLGMIGGAVINHGRGDPRAVTGPADLGPYGRALSDADRAALRKAIRAEGPRLRENREAVRAGFRELTGALRAEPYDHARVTAIIEGQQARVEAQVDLLRALMLDRVAQMTPAERAGFADRLEEVLRHGPPRDRDHGPERH